MTNMHRQQYNKHKQGKMLPSTQWHGFPFNPDASFHTLLSLQHFILSEDITLVHAVYCWLYFGNSCESNHAITVGSILSAAF